MKDMLQKCTDWEKEQKSSSDNFNKNSIFVKQNIIFA
jgi:hypothetical protein